MRSPFFSNSGVSGDLSLLPSAANVETDLVISIETTTANETFTLPLKNGATNATVDMGDGNAAFDITTYNDTALTAVYPTAGSHEIRVSGSIFGLAFGDAVDAAKLRTVDNLGNLSYQSMQAAFAGCTGLTSFVAGNCDTSAVALWTEAFSGCTSLVSCSLTGVDWSSTYSLQNTWAGCTNLTTINFGVIDSSEVNRMDGAFYLCPALVHLNMSNIDVSSLSPTGGMADFIDGANIKASDYDAALINIAFQAPLTSGIYFGASLTQELTLGGAAEAARAAIIQEGWFLRDFLSGVPLAMGVPSLVVDSATQITATRGADPALDGLPITSYDLRVSDDAGATWTETLGIGATSVLGSLTASTAYEVQTRAVNEQGAGAWSSIATATTAAVTADSAVIHTTTYSENTDTWTIETDKPNQGTWHWARYADETTGITPDGSGGWSSTPQESGTIAVGASGAALVIPETGPEGAKYALFIYQRTGTEDSNVLTVGYFVPLSRVPFVPTDYIASAKVLAWHDWRNAAQLRKTDLFATNDTPTTTGDTIYGVRDSSGNSRDLYDESATLLSTWDQEKEQTTLNSTIGWRMRNNFDATSGYEFHVSIKTADDQFMILSHQAPNWAGVVGVGDDSADVDSNMGSPVYYKNGVAIASPTRDILSTEYSTDTALAMGVSGLSFASASFSPKVLGYTDTNYALTGAVVTHTLFTAPLTATERDDISAALLLDAPENTA